MRTSMIQWNETARLCRRAGEIIAAGRSLAVATVVGLQGSAYRRPGARLLIDEEGHLYGNVSGGCLENDVREAALAAIHEQHGRLLHYDTGGDEDTLWGMGLGCGGSVDILVRPFTPASAALWKVLEEYLKGERGFLLAAPAAPETAPDQLLIWHPDEPAPLDVAQDDVRSREESGLPDLIETSQGPWFLQPFFPPPVLLLCGAGDDAIPLARLASQAGFRVCVADPRAAYLTAERFPEAWRLLRRRPEEGFGLALNEQALIVIMTHVLRHDRVWLRQALETPARYIGLLGPRDRRETLLEETPPAEHPRIHGPVGLDIGGEGPTQVAVSILAELLAIHFGRRGGFLKDRSRPLHRD